MRAGDTPAARITVWRPVRLTGEWFDASSCQPIEADHLHEPIYVFELRDGFADSVVGQEDSQKLSDLLSARLEIHQSPEHRSVSNLSAVIEAIDALLGAGKATWTDSLDRHPDFDEEPSVQLRQNQLLALRGRLEWIVDTFGAVPGASVSFR